MGKHRSEPFGEVVDLFCGAGALSHGLLKAGFEVKAGYDTDSRCRYAFETNNKAKFFARDVATLNPNEVASHFSGKKPSILAGCAPCQPFSAYKQRYNEDPQWNLVSKFAELAVGVMPDFVTMENVPALEKYKGGRVFRGFVSRLEGEGYSVKWSVVRCEKFGVPQKRQRLVLIAAKHKRASELRPKGDAVRSVRYAIGNLPKLEAGKTDPSDELHTSSSLSPLNMKRIQVSRPGRTWRDWPEDLRAQCHRKKSGRTYSGVYARMDWDKPSPTMTTQCYGFGNGRFGHPEQDRAISLREAAILQSFPDDYEFLPEGEKPSMKEVGRWIGNAVPVKLAEAIGHQIKEIDAVGEQP